MNAPDRTVEGSPAAIMTTLSFNTQNRIRGGAIALVVEGLIGYALILGFSVDIPAAVGDQLKLFNLSAPPPPPPLITRPKPQPAKSRKRRGAASPRNIKSQATEIVAPELPPAIPSPVVAAPKPYVGNESSTGATRLRGPGTGAGGIGTGTGSGGSGDGEGGDDTPPRWKSGKIKESDYAYASVARSIHVSGTGSITYTVSVLYTVETNGRATNCTIVRPSGNAAFDQITCQLIEERFRFKPSLDSAGRPFPSKMGEEHSFTLDYDEKSMPAHDREDRRDDR
jgi:protein TonB